MSFGVLGHIGMWSLGTDARKRVLSLFLVLGSVLPHSKIPEIKIVFSYWTWDM